MGHARSALVLVLIALAGPAAAGERACGSTLPVETVAGVFEAIGACWRPGADASRYGATIRFSLRRDGTLIGKPHFAYRSQRERSPASAAFETSILQALDRALPIPLSDAMGRAVAGRVFAYRFGG